MTPTIVLEDNRLRLALGSPGGSTIITTVLQVLLNVLVYELDVAEAIAAPRFHHQWLPDRLLLQEGDLTQRRWKICGNGAMRLNNGGVGVMPMPLW